MYRTFVILRHTFFEAIVQPIYTLLIALGAAILAIFGVLPFFTFGEDTIMFSTVAVDVILLLVLISTLFVTSRSIYEEIEDRTMLTLMSKPVDRWQVMLGKYLGIILAALLAVGILGVVLCLCVYWRIPGDYQLRAGSLDEREIQNLANVRWMHIGGLIPTLFMQWVQISVLAAISVAISTRVSLVVNLPVVIIIYVAGNLARFLLPMAEDPTRSPVTRAFAYLVTLLLPYLENFDIKHMAVLRSITLSLARAGSGALSNAQIWSYVALSTLYAACYATFALALGMLLFRSRELGGAEG